MKRRPRFPVLYDTPQGEIEEVARDFRWESAGCKVFFAVDAKDVIDYCFPLKPFDIAEQDLDTTAAEQTALDFVFCRRMPRPLLLPHYVDELSRFVDVIQNSASRAYEDLEMWNRIRWGLSLGTRKGTTEEGDEFSSLKKNIVRNLAVWLGIDSFGSERFRKILQHDLQSVKDMCRGINDPDLDSIIAEYKPLWVNEISDFLETQIPSSVPEHKRLARKEASRRDALAVDWLLYLNAKCTQLTVKHEDGHISKVPRYFFLYMSSAPKTEDLFKFLLQKSWYPLAYIDKDDKIKALNFHRNRRQILLVARAGWGGEEDRNRTSANLDEIALISRMIAEMGKDLKDACETCLLQGHVGAPDCTWREVCGAIEKIKSKTVDVPDLGLMSRLKQYHDILKARPRLSDQKLCLEELEQILRTGTIPDLALSRVLDQQSFAATQALLVRRLSEGNSLDPHFSLPEPMFLLTTIFSRLPSPYDQTQDLIAKYCLLDAKQTEDRQGVLLRAMHEFMEVDAREAAPVSKNHELARLLLHLAFGGRNGWFDVIERSRQLRESVEEVRKDPYPFFLCSLIASLQLHRYVDTQRYASEAIELCPDEPFLFHARGVNTFSWKRDVELRLFCARPIESCVKDEVEALRILRNQRSVRDVIKGFNYLEGLILNNLTFMQAYSQDGEFSQIFDLKQAQIWCRDLLNAVPEDNWRPRYFHTQSHLEYQLARSTPDDRARHLKKALVAIGRAVSTQSQDERYLKFQKQISDAMRYPLWESLPAPAFS